MMLDHVFHKIQTALAPQNPQLDLAWMDTLPSENALDALTEIKEKLRKINFTDLKYLSQKIDLVLSIDEKTYKKIKIETRNYLILLKNNKSLKTETELVVYEFYRQLFVNYTFILDSIQTQKQMQFSEEKLNLILARLLNAAFSMAKWRYFDNQSAPHGTWKTVHKVIKTAENLAIMNKNLFLYAYQMKETSIASILKRGFMMNTLLKGSFTPAQFELTEQILKIWATNPLIVNKYKQDRYQFYIKLEHDFGPERIRTIEKYQDCRFWRTSRLVDLMEAYLLAVNMQKPLTEFSLNNIAPTSVIVKLFKKLRAEWCTEGYIRQRRREVRIKKHELMHVSHGLESICHRLNSLQIKKLQKKPTDSHFTFELRQTMSYGMPLISANAKNVLNRENLWKVDESEQGFAVDLGKEVSGWINPGALIGYEPSETPGALWVAEVKSVRKQSNGTYRAGFRVLAKNPAVVHISCAQHSAELLTVNGYFVDNKEAKIEHYHHFLGLLMQNENATSTRLMIPSSEWKQTGSYIVTIDSEDHQFAIKRVLSKQRDWTYIEVTQ